MVPFFEEHPLRTAKNADFARFARVLHWMDEGRHLSEDGLWAIARETEQMNRRHLDAVARRAREQGVTTTQLAFHNPKPVKTALEVARTERIGLLVFGPDRKELGKRAFRKAVKRIREDPPCLVWVPAD